MFWKRDALLIHGFIRQDTLAALVCLPREAYFDRNVKCHAELRLRDNLFSRGLFQSASFKWW